MAELPATEIAVSLVELAATTQPLRLSTVLPCDSTPTLAAGSSARTHASPVNFTTATARAEMLIVSCPKRAENSAACDRLSFTSTAEGSPACSPDDGGLLSVKVAGAALLKPFFAASCRAAVCIESGRP